MKLSEMNEIKISRENTIGFLHFSDIAALNKLFNGHYEVDKKSFYEVCDAAIELYKAKTLDNRSVSRIFNILRKENIYFKTESHRYEQGKIYEYDLEREAYVFSCHGTEKEFNKLNHYI